MLLYSKLGGQEETVAIHSLLRMRALRNIASIEVVTVLFYEPNNADADIPAFKYLVLLEIFWNF
jgi:hypothetical protein